MLTETVEKALNEQINKELFSAYLYLSMAADFESKNLAGFAKWMKAQSAEELNHAMKLFNYVLERGGHVELMAIEKPQQTWESPLKAFQDAYDHERFITQSIYSLLEIAQSAKDYGTMEFLQWYVKEQVEEEAQAEHVMKKLEMINDAPAGLLMLDHELGQRE
ncbi:ferritin [Coprothermobacter proteolyticus]|nr:ferritin [Coprothermobacter proteolyticus]